MDNYLPVDLLSLVSADCDSSSIWIALLFSMNGTHFPFPDKRRLDGRAHALTKSIWSEKQGTILVLITDDQLIRTTKLTKIKPNTWPEINSNPLDAASVQLGNEQSEPNMKTMMINIEKFMKSNIG